MLARNFCKSRSRLQTARYDASQKLPAKRAVGSAGVSPVFFSVIKQDRTVGRRSCDRRNHRDSHSANHKRRAHITTVDLFWLEIATLHKTQIKTRAALSGDSCQIRRRPRTKRH